MHKWQALAWHCVMHFEWHHITLFFVAVWAFANHNRLYIKLDCSVLKVDFVVKHVALLLLLVAALFMLPESAHAQSARQTFQVVVPTRVSASTPSSAGLTFDLAETNKVFPVQTWTVHGNAVAGVNVSFAAQSFINTSRPSVQRDAELQLEIGDSHGPGAWAVQVNRSASNFHYDIPAVVTAQSTGLGRANLKLSVAFLSDSQDMLASGDFIATVVGTVSGN